MQTSIDPSDKWLYQVGGLSAIVLFVGYLLTFAVIPTVGGLWPEGTEARLIYFSEHTTGWWMMTTLMVFTDLLYIPVWLAVYQAFKGINRHAMLLAFVFECMFVALDLATTWTAQSSYLTLGSSYAAASDAQQSILMGAAGYASTIMDSPLLGIYVIFVPSLGFLIAAPILLKGSFSKATGYIAWGVALSGIAASIGTLLIGGLDAAKYINAMLAMIWFLLIGLKLYKLSRQ